MSHRRKFSSTPLHVSRRLSTRCRCFGDQERDGGAAGDGDGNNNDDSSKDDGCGGNDDGRCSGWFHVGNAQKRRVLLTTK